MKLTKKIIAELAKAYRCTMAVSILDMQAPLSYITEYIAENIKGYGTAADEKVCSRADYRRMITAGRKQSKGKVFKAKILTPYKPWFSDETTAQFQDEIQVQVGNGKDKHTLHLWMSTVFKRKDDRWQMVLFHGSMPDAASSSADTFHIKEAEKKVKELERVVAQRTLDLKNKNRELEIEAALERVRAVAMGMKDSANMLDVCKTITQQLQLLGIKEIRNVQTAVINKERGTYVNYEFYAKHNKQLITEVSYTDHPMTKAFIKKMLDGPNEFFKRSLKGTKVKEWYRFQKQSTQQFADRYLLTALSLDYYWYSLGPVALGVSTYKPLSKEAQALVIRLRNVFDLAYRRHLDIENAKAQAREAQIEAALERVRSRSMAMHKSNELKDVIKVVLEQFVQLNINVGHAGFYIDYKAHDDMHIWLADPNIEPFFAVIPYFNTPTWNSFIEAKARGTMLHTDLLDFKTKNKFYKSLFKLFTVPEDAQQFYMQCKGLAVSTVLLENVGLYIENFSAIPYTDEENEILIRFGKVFQQTYTRFLDLQKAEAQAREAQIETALEKIRSRSLAMHKSDELIEVVNTVFERLSELGIEQDTAIINTMDEGTRDTYMWIESKNQKYTNSIRLPYFHHTISKDVWNAYDAGEEAFCKLYSREEKNEWFKIAFEISDLRYIPEERKSFLLETPVYAISVAFAKNISIQVISFSDNTLNAAESEVLKRFTKVFYQSYTRFLDLQKAEAQALEAEIELALERVRARTMAMQKSEDLKSVVKELYEQLRQLGFKFGVASIIIMDEVTGDFDWWMEGFEDGYELPEKYHVPYFNHTGHNQQLEHWKAGNNYKVIEISGADKKMYDNYYFFHTDFSRAPESSKNLMMSQEAVIFSMAYTRYGALSWSPTKLDEQQAIVLQRMAKVFEQTYTRFLDLQKAEAQAREAQVEAALERVRSRSMAMHKSEELGELSFELVKQVQALGIATWHCAFNIYDEDQQSSTEWGSNAEGSYPIYKTPREGIFLRYYEAGQRGETLHVEEIGEDICADHYKYLCTLPGVGETLLRVRDSGIPFPKSQIDHVAYFKYGYLLFITFLPVPDAHDIFKRFAKVFEQTYIRFLDLKKSEAQAREAQIEAALERVRSRTLAMQKSDELADTAAELFKQLITLGIEPNRLYIGIVHGDTKDMEMWATDEDGSGVGKKFTFNAGDNSSVQKLYDGWAAKIKSVTVDMQGTELEAYIHYLKQLHIPLSHALTQKRRVQSVAYFDKGFIGMASPDEQSAQSIQLLERFAAVFNLTFTRFNDLKLAEAHALQAEHDLIAIKEAKQKAEVALSELQATQKQLIQAEKMASLGELTAGIAHEIQNPLNFVNNFSEINKELLGEMQAAIAKGDFEEAGALAKDISDNQEKINHHGKRADGIVKSMLQHSRASSGKKELSDINVLCDEYLRLAFHGLRAKDKSFNAKFETRFDPLVGKLMVLSQDIGRVVLNLINNAFYAVTEKKKLNIEGYEPTVTVFTKKLEDKIQITIQDNGTGIPEPIKEKIFQPFFTTKPTGQGTGLGLSLSYDIIKAHGGEILIESVEETGSTFTISLPSV